MAYVDYKCLESLLIEGDDLIATEGIGNAIGNLVKGIIRIINNAISVIIRCFKNLFAKIKRSKGNTSNKTNSSNINEERAERNNQRDNSIKKSEDVRKQIREDFEKLHEDSEKELAENTKKLEESKKQFEENHKQRKAELDEAIKRMNKTVYRNNDDEDDNDNKSGSEIARDIITAIGYIERMTSYAKTCMTSIHTIHTKDDIEDSLPESTKIKELITNIDSMQNTIDLYDIAEDKLTDSNKNDICKKLQSAITKLDDTKSTFDKAESIMKSKLDRVLSNRDNDSEIRQVYNYTSRQLKYVQNGLIAAQKLSVSLMKLF